MVSRISPGVVRLVLSVFLASVSGLLLSSCGLVGQAASVGLLKMQFGCLPEGTLIDTPTGAIPVERLKAGDSVIGYSGSVVVVTQVHQYQEDPAAARHLAVTFEGGEEIQLSPRHRIIGVPACELAAGEDLGGNVVSQVRALGGVSRSFDLLTDDAGYRVQGIPVNSMIEEMASR